MYFFRQMVVSFWNLRPRGFYDKDDFIFMVGAQILSILHSRKRYMTLRLQTQNLFILKDRHASVIMTKVNTL